MLKITRGLKIFEKLAPSTLFHACLNETNGTAWQSNGQSPAVFFGLRLCSAMGYVSILCHWDQKAPRIIFSYLFAIRPKPLLRLFSFPMDCLCLYSCAVIRFRFRLRRVRSFPTVNRSRLKIITATTAIKMDATYPMTSPIGASTGTTTTVAFSEAGTWRQYQCRSMYIIWIPD